MIGKLTGYSLAATGSLVLHGTLLAALIIGWTPSQKDIKVRPQYIKATLLQIEAPKVAVKKPAPRKAAVKKARKAPVDTKRQEHVKKQQKQRADDERLRKAREKKRKQEKAKELAQQQARQRATELAFAEALEQEEQFIAAGQDELLVNSYSAYINDRIASNWSRPPSARRGMEVILRIQLVPTGRVVSVMIEKSSGNDAFDRSAEQAVHKVDRFDRLQDLSRDRPRVFESTFRRFRLIFRPDDLRL